MLKNVLRGLGIYVVLSGSVMLILYLGWIGVFLVAMIASAIAAWIDHRFRSVK